MNGLQVASSDGRSLGSGSKGDPGSHVDLGLGSRDDGRGGLRSSSSGDGSSRSGGSDGSSKSGNDGSGDDDLIDLPGGQLLLRLDDDKSLGRLPRAPVLDKLAGDPDDLHVGDLDVIVIVLGGFHHGELFLPFGKVQLYVQELVETFLVDDLLGRGGESVDGPAGRG